jgi:hypothetical protein
MLNLIKSYLNKHCACFFILNEQYIINNYKKINFNKILTYQSFSEEFIRSCNEEFLRDKTYPIKKTKILNSTSWYYISEYQKLSESFIREFSDKVDWENISQFQKLSEEFIIEFFDKVNWYNISKYQKLSEKFIRENSNKVSWYLISFFQKLSEAFIIEFSDKVEWNLISIYQKLSEEFIRRYSDKVNWYNISQYQKLSPEFIKEFNLEIPETCWLYKDKEFKRKYIQENTSYEIIGDKVIAYKSCRGDGYSAFNFQYYYEVDGEYECHADYNIDEKDSFGLSAWTKRSALEYYNCGKLFKVEIDLEDIAAIVHNHNKIRASKIKILEEIF